MAQCNACGFAFPVALHGSVNATCEPELKQKLINRELITFVCPKCGACSDTPHDILYHDMVQQIMIIYASKNANGVSSIATTALNFGEDVLKNYRLRIVTEWNHLVERIAVIDAGLDDFIFESVKTHVWLTHSQSNTLAPDTFLLEYITHGPSSSLVYHFVDTIKCAATALEVEDNGIYKNFFESIYGKLGVSPFPNGEWAVIGQQTAFDRVRHYSK